MTIFYNFPPRLDNLNSIYIILLGAYYRKFFLIFQQLNYKQTLEPQFFASLIKDLYHWSPDRVPRSQDWG